MTGFTYIDFNFPTPDFQLMKMAEWSTLEAIIGFSCTEIIVLSSVLIEVGWSNINILIKIGAVIAPWGTPACILDKVEILVRNT